MSFDPENPVPVFEALHIPPAAMEQGGVEVAAAQFLVAKDPMLLGGDSGPVEVSPNPDRSISIPIHQMALVVNGIHLLENMKLDDLAAKSVYEFAFIVQPLKMQGFTGSTVAPIAIR